MDALARDETGGVVLKKGAYEKEKAKKLKWAVAEMSTAYSLPFFCLFSTFSSSDCMKEELTCRCISCDVSYVSVSNCKP